MNYPSAIRARCPACGDANAYRLGALVPNPNVRISTASSSCASCGEVVRFVLIYESADSKFPSRAYFTPAPSNEYDWQGGPATMPSGIKRAMEETVASFNAGIFGATTTLGRRTLEGIFKSLLSEPHQNKKLYELILQAMEEVDFSEPLDRLATAIRKGGNIGAHFDETKEADAKMARQTIELLDYLINYLYVLPNKIKELEKAIEGES